MTAKNKRDDNSQDVKTSEMASKKSNQLKDGARCKVVGGTHVGKSGTVHDIKTGKTGYVSITVRQANGTRFKTLAKNVVVI